MVASLIDDDEVAERNTIVLVDGQKTRILGEAMEVIQQDIFQSGGLLVRLTFAGNMVSLTPISGEAVDAMLNNRGAFKKWAFVRGRGGQERSRELVDADSPPWLAKQIVGLQRWDSVREIESISYVPFIREDGTVGGKKRGYDAESRCWVATSTDVEIPDFPTETQANEAKEKILQIVDEFPFSHEAGRSVYLATVLTIIGRRFIRGSVPITVIEAAAPGTGKTLLASLIGIMGTGQPPGMANGDIGDTEMEKFLTAFLRTGNQVLVFDNVAKPLGGPVINRFVTAGNWTSRLLGKSESLCLPNNTVSIMAANNPKVAPDTARRSLQIRLVAKCENPEEREFTIKNLKNHVTELAPELAAAACTIIRWHLTKGCPEPTPNPVTHTDDDGPISPAIARPLGGFEEWSKVVRWSVVALGMPDPATTTESIRELDEKAMCRKDFIRAWANWASGFEGNCRQFIDAVYHTGLKDSEQLRDMRNAIDDLATEKTSDTTQPSPSPSASALGYALRYCKDMVIGEFRVRKDGTGREGGKWRLEKVNRA